MKKILNFSEWKKLDEGKISDIIKKIKDGGTTIIKKIQPSFFKKQFKVLDNLPIPNDIKTNENIYYTLNEQSNWENSVVRKRNEFIDILRKNETSALEYSLAEKLAHNIYSYLNRLIPTHKFDIEGRNIIFLDMNAKNITNGTGNVFITIIEYIHFSHSNNPKRIHVTYHIQYIPENKNNPYDFNNYKIRGYVIGKDINTDTYEYLDFPKNNFKLNDYDDFAMEIVDYIEDYCSKF